MPPVPLFGSAMSVLFHRMSFFDFMLKIYNFNPNAKYLGLYFMTNPVFLFRDLELIKTVLVKNFEAFPDRRGFADFNDFLFKKNLFSLRGEKWRNVRNLLSPSFTSSKMKMMFTLMSECAVDFAKFLSSPANKGDIDMKDVCSKYTNDVIATCAFGIKVNSMKDPTNEFYTYGKEASNFRGVSRSIKFFFIGMFPTLVRILNIKFMDDYLSNFFKDIVRTTIATRDAEHITRPDMLQLMMDIRGKEGRRELDIDDMTAQAFIFFLGGFETSSTAMCFAAHEIAANPEIQLKLQQEIDKVLEESNGEVSYEAINRLEYLDAVICEALRLYPPVAVLERICEKTFELPSALPDQKPFIMKKGMLVWIPVLAIHRDEKYYDNPEKFDPERFLNNKMHNSSSYMPFGSGPRMCIANRFAMLEVKVLLFHLLAQCELKPSVKTISPIKFCKDLIIMPENGFWLNIQGRKNLHSVQKLLLNMSIIMEILFEKFSFHLIYSSWSKFNLLKKLYFNSNFYNENCICILMNFCNPKNKSITYKTPMVLCSCLESIYFTIIADTLPRRNCCNEQLYATTRVSSIALRIVALRSQSLFIKCLKKDLLITSVCAMEYWSILLSIVIGVISIYYLFKNFNFFKRNGIIHLPPVPLFGSTMSVVFRRISIFDFILKKYNLLMTTPVFLLELIKTVLVKNFEAFPDHRGFVDFNDFLFKKNLFSLRGEKWRNVRNLLSPSFTSSKMKMMFTLMSECAVDFAKFLSTSSTDKGSIDMKDICSKYTNDIIATCAFGIKINSIKDPTNKFYIYGKEATNFRGVIRGIKFFFLSIFPRLGRILNLKIINEYVSDFFKDIVRTTIANKRPDMLQLMMDIRGKRGHRELDIDDMTAQAFIFFLGGFETSSTTMCYTAHEIAANPEIQIKLQQEIDKILEESNGEVSYETINRLEYLDAVICEALRLYPPIGFLERMCKKTYELPSALPDRKPFIIKKDMLVWIPIFAIQRDEKYFDNPEKFDPERFLDNKMHNSSCYMPFGLGPKMCIANRFDLLVFWKKELVLSFDRSEHHIRYKPGVPTRSPKSVQSYIKGIVVQFSNNMEYYWSILLSMVIGVISIHYLFRNFNFFKRHGIIHIPPIPIFGSMTSSIFFRTSFVDSLLKIYNFNPNAKYYGSYLMTNPVFLLRDPQLIKNILVKNFESFPNRFDLSNLNDPLVKNNLFTLWGEKWQNVRNLLSPSFTPSKMKMMFTLISECAKDFTKFITILPADKGSINMKDAFSKYTNDVIATCAFGIKINSMKDPTNEFYINSKKIISNFKGIRVLKFLLIRTFPKLSKIFNFKIVDDYLSDYFKGILRTTIATRDAEHITRPDMLQLMMDIRSKGGHKELDIDDMIAQAFIFFLGGFETSSTTMCFAAHEIAANPKIQLKLQQKIDKVLEESHGEVSYEIINQLEYLDAVISETLRLYPPFPILERICEKAYELPSALPDEKSVIVKKGMSVWVPVFAIQRDEKYLDNPEKFDPERFLDNKMQSSSWYMPFGCGPRMCIANRFAMLEIKVLLFHLLARCELKPSAKTTSPIKFRKDLMLMPENGFWLNIQSRKD
ncbi:CP9E2 protein, partial [Pseudoatta argentina]